MNTEKFDAALRVYVADQHHEAAAPVDVSIRLEQPMDASQARELAEIGMDTADTRRRIFFARLPIATLQNVSDKPWVKQISLSQTMHPKANLAGKG